VCGEHLVVTGQSWQIIQALLGQGLAGRIYRVDAPQLASD
jgi:hypothetical protein